MGVDRAQGVQAVAGEGEERAGVVRAARIRLVDNRVYSSLPQRHRGHRTGHAPADDQSFLRAAHEPSFPGAKIRQSLSVIAQIRNVAGLLPMGRTRLLWNAAKRHSAPSRTATRVWIESRSGEGFVLPRITVPPVAWTIATSGLGNLMLRTRPVRRVPLRNLSKSRWCDAEISRRPLVRVPSKAT